MPSFDIVSEIDKHELSNAIDQANKEVGTRFDFKGSKSNFVLSGSEITMNTESDFQLDQMFAMLLGKLAKRGIELKSLERKDADIQMKTAKQVVLVKEGIDASVARIIIKKIKDSKLKVKCVNQGDSVRVTGKKRNDLQEIIGFLRQEDSIEVALQFNNFRD